MRRTPSQGGIHRINSSQYLIFYRISADRITRLDILNDAMDLKRSCSVPADALLPYSAFSSWRATSYNAPALLPHGQ